MKIKRWLIKMGIGVGCTVAALICLLGLQRLEGLIKSQTKEDPTEKVSAAVTVQYNDYGLPVGQKLSEEVVYMDNEVTAYSDRIVRRFQYSSDYAGRISEIAEALCASFPADVSLSVLPVPGRFLVEEELGEDVELYQTYLQEIREGLPATVTLLDVMPVLLEHEDEYLFFRTEDCWTALAALYGMETVCENWGIRPYTKTGYYEYNYNTFKGWLWSDFQQKVEELPEGLENMEGDLLYFYQLPDGKNIETLVKGEETVYKRPTISRSAGGMETFVGGVFEYAIVEGDGLWEETKDENVLLIGDDTGKVLAPFLANYFQSVYVVHVEMAEDFEADLSFVLENYGIRKVIWAQSARTMGRRSYTAALNQLIEE